MPKHKVPTPQEIYWARKQAQDAYLPPGLINHGNTCFMNSVLQGLIATRLLADLAQFHDIPQDDQSHSNTLLLSRRSPQLTNAHGIAGPYEKDWVDMPIGDRFVDIMYRAWRVQSQRKRENLSPKDLLAAVGRKYDQYLDFAQQDAHEFLRILLDAMRMEEQDVIKQRQPPPPKRSKKRRQSSEHHPSPSIPQHASLGSQHQPLPLSEADTLISFCDMIFGGKLTSILVCQKCKHISQTYEDFNDISLSLKPEDYAVIHSRKRDRFKKFAKKFTAFPSTALVVSSTTQSSSTNANNSAIASKQNGIDEGSNEPEPVNDGSSTGGVSGRMGMALSIPRPSSVPPSPRERDDPQISDKLPFHLMSRRRSMEHLQSDLLVPSSGVDSNLTSDPSSDRPANDDTINTSHSGTDDANPIPATIAVSGPPDASDWDHKRASSNETKETESDGSNVIVNGNAVPTLILPSEEKHVGFVATEKLARDGKEKKKRDGDDGWSKISRRISLTVKLGRRDKDKDKEKEKLKDKDKDKDKDSESSKLKKQSRRFSGLPSKSKTSSSPAPNPDIQNPSLARVSQETSAQPPSPGGSSAGIMASASSPGLLPSPNDSTHSQPPIVAPVPLRSLSSQSNNIPRLSTPLQSLQTHMNTLNNHVQAQVQKVSSIQRSRSSAKPPKQAKEEQEYLRRILADVAPAPVPTTRTPSTTSKSNGVVVEKGGKSGGGGSDVEKSRLKTSTHLGISGSNNRSYPHEDNLSTTSTTTTTTSVGTWLPIAAMSQFSGLEECLRMFTAVEVLDGENMVGCRRCWKIQNGHVKGSKEVEDSDEDEDEDKEHEGEKEERMLVPPAPPLQSFDSQSSTHSNTTFASAESGQTNRSSVNGSIAASPGHSPMILSASTPTLIPLRKTFTSENSIPTPPRLPHRSNSSPIVEQTNQWKSPIHPIPATPTEKHRVSTTFSSPSSPRTVRPLPNTPGGLPIPRISTTPAAEPSSLNGVRSGTGVVAEDILEHDLVIGNGTTETDESRIQTPLSGSSQSSVLLESKEESVDDTEEEIKKRRRGMIFRSSLVVPTRMPGRHRRKPKKRRTTRPGSMDGVASLSGSEAESVSSNGSFSRSASPSEASESEEEESDDESSVSDVSAEMGHHRRRDDELLAPPPGYEQQTPTPTTTSSTLKSNTNDASTTSSLPPSPSKPLAKPKKKKEVIMRPAYKRYLVSVPPPVLVIHLKRFQHLNSHNSSALSSFAEKLTAGFSSSPSGGRGASYGGGFGGFGGIGSGGFKKLEEFVSFPEWLDLSPFLAPKKEHLKRTKSQSSNDGRNGTGRSTTDKDGRCTYRLYAVVVHIGNMLGGHYIAYVALPGEQSTSSSQTKEGDNGTERSNSTDEASATGGGKQHPPGVPKPIKRQWAYISDTNVRLVSLEEVLNARAYICMYERV